MSPSTGETILDHNDDDDVIDYSHGIEGGSTGVKAVDIVLIQHLLHCEFLLQHLQVHRIQY